MVVARIYSIVLVHHSFSVCRRRRGVSLRGRDVILLRGGLTSSFTFYSPSAQQLSVSRLAIYRCLRGVHRLPHGLKLRDGSHLLVGRSPPVPLIATVFSDFGRSKMGSPVLDGVLCLSYLSVFSRGGRLVPLLFGDVDAISKGIRHLVDFSVTGH